MFNRHLLFVHTVINLLPSPKCLNRNWGHDICCSLLRKDRVTVAFSCSCYTVLIRKGRALVAFSCFCYTVVIRKCRTSVNVLSPVSHHTLIIIFKGHLLPHWMKSFSEFYPLCPEFYTCTIHSIKNLLQSSYSCHSSLARSKINPSLNAPMSKGIVHIWFN